MINVLVVDDEPLVRASIKSITDWESQGFNVELEAADGIEATNILKTNDIDIILLDINMPRQSGIEFLEQNNDLIQNKKIIILSAYSEYKYIRQAFKLGAEDYILKSEIDEDILLKLLDKVSATLKKEKITTVNSEKLYNKVIIKNIVTNSHMEVVYELLNSNRYNFNLPVYCYYLVSEKLVLEGELNLLKVQAKQFSKNQNLNSYFVSLENNQFVFIFEQGDTNYIDDFIELSEDIIGITLEIKHKCLCNSIKEVQTNYNEFIQMTTKKTRSIKKIEKYIEDNFSDCNLSLEFIAEKYEMTASHLSYQFKKETGFSFKKYITLLRLNHAKHLLKTSNFKIYEIALASGYPNVEHFSKTFKKHTGVSPKEFSINT